MTITRPPSRPPPGWEPPRPGWPASWRGPTGTGRPLAATDAALAALSAVPAHERTGAGLLAAAFLADRAGRPAELGEALAAVVRHPQLAGRFDADQQAALARWGISVHLRLDRFAEASEAVKALPPDRVTAGDRALLVACRTLQAGQLLRGAGVQGAKVDPASLAEVDLAVSDVLAEQPDDPAALLLAATVKVLRGQAPSAEHAALAARLPADGWPSADQQLLVQVNRLFAGAGTADQVEALLKAAELPTPDKRFLQILAANQARDVNRLAAAVEKVLPELTADPGQSPVDPAELAAFVGQFQLWKKRIPNAEATLRRLRDAAPGDPRAARLLAVALTLRAGQLLRPPAIPDLLGARRRLEEARQLLATPPAG